MDKVLCDISALRFYRVPPRYLYALPPLPDFDTPYGRSLVRSSFLAREVLGLPLHALALNGPGVHSNLVKSHVWRGDLPFSSVVDTPFDVSVTSPLLTLRMLSARLSEVELAMLIYEFTGTFSVFSPSKELEEACSDARMGHIPSDWGVWKRVTNRYGTPTDLWCRPPLLKMDEIRECIDMDKGGRGRKRLERAMRLVTGEVASPFEAQASMLLAAPRPFGGRGLKGVRNNMRIDLDRDARRICDLSHVVGDLVWPGNERHRTVVVECQGAVVHDAPSAAAADDDRALALQSMGIEVIRITYQQIADRLKFDAFARHLAKRLGVRQRPATHAMLAAEDELRKAIFVNWRDVGGTRIAHP